VCTGRGCPGAGSSSGVVGPIPHPPAPLGGEEVEELGMKELSRAWEEG